MWNWQFLPVAFVFIIYLPAALLGAFLFEDKWSFELLLMLFVFLVLYCAFYDLFFRVSFRIRFCLQGLVSSCLIFYFSVAVVFIYFALMLYLFIIAEDVPILVALGGGGVMDVAYSRGQFIAGLTGYDAVARYLYFILGKSVVPMLLVAAFSLEFRFRYVLFLVFLFFSCVSLEKAYPIFICIPLIFYFAWERAWKSLLIVFFLMGMAVVFLTLLASGFNAKSISVSESRDVAVFVAPDVPVKESVGDGSRFLLPYFLEKRETGNLVYEYDPGSNVSDMFVSLLNRIFWIPYITAYDWLKFQDDVLDGDITLGRSITFIHGLWGEPKMPLEKMVYAYQFGASPGGQGASNVLFLVDAKLAFGWFGVVLYSLVLTFCAACIFSSGSKVLICSSVVCFLTVSVSPLSATLFSGGLFIYVSLACVVSARRKRIYI